ncbi:DNA/RNA non-specific endonuclease [Polaribacter sp. R77954]|uniref:DNA/RNA non-specific endonuclease n=1 Tax=Polaribacter sp. R77954 TaxID=3093870 RepID=UPI0037CB39C7
MKRIIILALLILFPKLINSQILKTVKNISDDVLEVVHKKSDLDKKTGKIAKKLFISSELKKWGLDNGFDLVAGKYSTKIYSKSGEMLGTITSKGTKKTISTYSLIGRKSVNPLLNAKVFPSATYKVDNTIFKTDRHSRVLKARSPSITNNNPNRKSLTNTYRKHLKEIEKIGGIKNKDQRGHLIAHFLGGNSGAINIVAQLGTLNQKKFKWIEELVGKNRKFIKNYEVDVIYKGQSKRPYAFKQKFEFRGDLRELKKEQIKNPTLKYIKKIDENGNTFYKCITYHKNS